IWVITVEELLAGFGSLVVLETDAVLLIVVPSTTSELTFTTSVNVAVAPAARPAMLQLTVPLPPATGVLHVNVGPVVWVNETNVVLAGTVSVITTLAASLGPGLVTVIGEGMWRPARCSPGPVFVTGGAAPALTVVV